ncbi:DNA recombination protein RmuC [Hyphococcus sp.]|uniref:DNA recombination protein RmuC n=1 Tax=Hyphococcus sp. TaxID=2038636 RepID=UPI003CCBFF5B
MQMLTPSAQQGADVPENAASGAQSAAALEPFISGPAPALWAGVGAFILIFVLLLMLIIRGRVVRPGRRKVKHTPPNYFEPAGEDADISFDDPQFSDAARRDADKRAVRETPDADVTAEDARISEEEGGGDQASHAREKAPPDVEHREPEKKRSVFAGLFSQKTEQVTDETPEEEVRIFEPEETFFDEEEDEPHADTAQTDARQSSFTSPPMNDGRLSRIEDAAEQALIRADEAENLARDLARANADTERTIALGLQENEAALTAMSDRLTALAKDFQSRLDTAPMQALEMREDAQGLSEAHFAEFADLIGEQFESLRNTVNDAIERLSRRIDHLPAAAPHAVASTAARVQLSDLLSDALPAQRYQLAHKLSSGRTADACIDMPGRLAPIPVDARFPVEAFDAWQQARLDITAKEAETQFRRIIYRHIADSAEKLLISGETADCAMMFVPSEHILSELHAHFPDVIQESYRAKLWMVAPTSLMATLHTLSAVISGSGLTARTQNAGDENVARELTALRERITALETKRITNGAHDSLEKKTKNQFAPTVDSASPSTSAAATTPSPREAEPASQEKPAFPLR